MKTITLKPRLSEKTYAQSEQGVYVFVVDTDLNKHEIAAAVASTYDVTVTKVRTIIQNGKSKRVYRNRKFENGVRSDIKKAYVTLQKGDQIPIFAAVEEEKQQTEELAQALDKKAKKEAKKAEKKGDK